jgi:hypothetical protein
VLEDGVTGFIVDSMEEAIERTRRVGELSRFACRAAFERRFTAAQMASSYVQLYHSLLAKTRSNLVA